jgi:hypothetical protein
VQGTIKFAVKMGGSLNRIFIPLRMAITSLEARFGIAPAEKRTDSAPKGDI